MSKENSCAFTGHRLLSDDCDLGLLDRVVYSLLKRGIDTFYNGMAKGFDLAAAEIVLRYKKSHGARLVACIPYPGQADAFSLSDKERYSDILKYCDEKIVFSPEYNRLCMYARDRFMVDSSSVVICYLRKQSGGTFYTVNYAKARGVKIINI